MVAFSSPALSDIHKGKRKNIEALLPTNIQTPVEEAIALGPHPKDPAYGRYEKEFKEKVAKIRKIRER
ncbi:MAG: hypothetical protein ACREXS_19115 [Gammaproteobacteria bacterium]